ncbi:tRNA (adenosine(37)-N6)-threonylcarbamoyltransferase complex dimerization subunit type 1 TsaB [Shouchella patagoniensis]|uniref:tRNA (adenosine(37)-N6)-threonylcarbamoyltransferase complex dimerization subunit type 1 TsaB n=1 Tax=Shouchella patagoniensis TaxID=228576 RepID=UPI0009952658|nr:tRNA (adenosine(37)-N6)-threonylcarbamoyltransferase complex dimerization subunit type 1 TsaB [Shouchella patagoniensis]
MANILALDTSSYRLGIAVSNEDAVLGEYMTLLKKNHALRLMPAVEVLLEEVGLKPKELDRIAVAHGPGSYTGVRMAVTTAKTLAWSLNIPLVSISTLELMAQAGKYFPGTVVPLIDARRQTVFTGAYQYIDGELKEVLPDKHVPLDEWLNELENVEGSFLFIGEDVGQYQTMIENVLGERLIVAEQLLANVRPGELCVLASRKEPVKNLHSFAPEYLRLAEAEVNWRDAQERGNER